MLLAWRDPLFQLHQSMAHQQDFNSFSSNKALEMGDMAHELRKGVEKVAEKVSHVKAGNIRNGSAWLRRSRRGVYDKGQSVSVSFIRNKQKSVSPDYVIGHFDIL